MKTLMSEKNIHNGKLYVRKKKLVKKECCSKKKFQKTFVKKKFVKKNHGLKIFLSPKKFWV